LVQLKKNQYGNVSEELEFRMKRAEIQRKEDEICEHAQGVIVKPRKGSGVFWIDLPKSGIGGCKVNHEGLPVQEERKSGMNIWVKMDFGCSRTFYPEI
jgi:hypothetical protein